VPVQASPPPPRDIWIGIEIPVMPYRRHIFVTGQVSGVDRDTPLTVDFSSSLYFHGEGEGVLLGMSNEDELPGYDTSVDWSFFDQVIEVAARRAPVFLEAELRTAWGGLYEITPDHQPIVGRIAAVEGLWAACGSSGHGFMQAPAIGQLLADEFTGLGSSIDLGPFSLDRFADVRLSAEKMVI
jgi:sarcosine oxidase, subunit beta